VVLPVLVRFDISNALHELDDLVLPLIQVKRPHCEKERRKEVNTLHGLN